MNMKETIKLKKHNINGTSADYGRQTAALRSCLTILGDDRFNKIEYNHFNDTLYTALPRQQAKLQRPRLPLSGQISYISL